MSYNDQMLKTKKQPPPPPHTCQLYTSRKGDDNFLHSCLLQYLLKDSQSVPIYITDSQRTLSEVAYHSQPLAVFVDHPGIILKMLTND